MEHSRIGTFLIVTTLCAQTAQADELRLRGGITATLDSEYTYATINDTTDQITADYGTGGMIALNYMIDDLYGGVGLDLGLQFSTVSGGDLFAPDGCDAQTFLGLISDCQDSAEVDNRTSFADIHALTSYSLGSGQTQLLAGVSALGFRNELNSEHLFPGGFENFVDRDTEFRGLGVKLGARHQIALPRDLTFNIEGFVGQYRGDREMTITDLETDAGEFNQLQEETLEDKIDVTTIEITPSILMPAAWAGDGASIEFGISYKLFQGVVNTRNVVAHGEFDAFEAGRENDDIATTSLFAGLTIPLY